MKKAMRYLCSSVLVLSLMMSVALCYGAEEPNLKENLQVYYNFDGENALANSGALGEAYDAFTTVADYWHADGSAANGTTAGKNGYGKAAKLVSGDPAVTSWIQLPAGILSALEKDITLSFWYQGTENTPTGSAPLGFAGNGLSFFLSFAVKEDGAMKVSMTDTTGVLQVMGDNTVSCVGWHMYTLVIKRGTGTDTVKFYVDGILVETDETYQVYDYYGKNQADANDHDQFSSVGRGYFADPMSDGAIDEIRMYNAALTGDQVTELYDTPFQKQEEKPGQSDGPNEENPEPGNTNGNDKDPGNLPSTGDIPFSAAGLAALGAAAAGLVVLKKRRAAE